MTPDKPVAATASGLVDHDETRLLNGRVVCLQPTTGYRTAIDPVLLAAAVDAKPGQRVLDAGAGTGAASLCLAARVGDLRITGIEIQPDYAALARRSAALNGWSAHVRVIDGDLAALPAGRDFREFDHVMTNPPYVAAGQGRLPPDGGKARAHVESNLDLAAWLEVCVRVTRSRGTLTVIHRADRLDQILAAMTGKLGQIVVFPFWGAADQRRAPGLASANRVLVQGRKGVNAPTALRRGLSLHEDRDGAFSAPAREILEGGRALKLFD